MMIAYTNPQAQTLQPGEAAVFNSTTYGCNCCSSSPRISRTGTYTVTFHGNLGAVAPGSAELVMAIGGVEQPSTSMVVTTAAAGDLANVSAECLTRIGCCQIGSNLNNITIINAGDTACTLGANPSLIIEGE